MKRRRITVSAALAALLLAATAAPWRAVRADYTAIVNPSQTWGTWEGWGSSQAWWAHALGDKPNADMYADLIYTTRTVHGYPGLGLNIVRYNIGGGYANQPAGNEPSDWWKNIIGFWRDWPSSVDQSTWGASGWDWSADANQRNMLRKAKDRGANLFEAFSDSPMWWMNYNHSTAGSSDGGNNLTTWNYDQFAFYLAHFVRHALNYWGIQFSSVEAFNEPSESWWRFRLGQEGCHFDLATQQTIIAKLRQMLDNEGLSLVAVTAADENSMDRALSTWNSYDAATRSIVGKVNVHGYQGIDPYRGTNRGPLRQAVGFSKRIWVSEYGDPDYAGMWMADTIMRDLYGLRPNGWCYWQPVEPFSGWGLINADYDSGNLTAVNRKFYVYGQFTRYVRPGYQIIDIQDHNSIAAYDPNNKRLVIVTLNFGTGQYVGYDLSRFRSIGGTFQRIGTTTAPGDGIPDWKQYTDSHPINDPANKRFWAYFYPNTIQTFIIDDVLR